MSNIDSHLLLKDPPIYYDIDRSTNPILYKDNKNQTDPPNMTNINDIITGSLVASKHTLFMTGSQMNPTVLEIIRQRRCNTVLDMTKQQLSSDTWKELQQVIVAGVWPPLLYIDLKGSNLSKENVDSRIRSMVI